MSLAQVFTELNVSQAQFGKDMKLSRSSANRLVKDCVWPKRNVIELRRAAEEWLIKRGASKAQLVHLYTVAESAEQREQEVQQARAQAQAQKDQPNKQEKEELMSVRKEPLRIETRQHFGLPCNPFMDDVQTMDDVFQTPSVRHVRMALMDCAQHCGFLAVVGQSGAGKSTLSEDLEERIRVENKNIVIIKPYVQAMEATEKKGKPMKSMQVADAIAAALDPHAPLKAAPNQRFEQIHKMLINSHRAGTRHLILIEEAHAMPRAMLKHLKRFLELKDGLQRTLGIALIAQPELLETLSTNSNEIREVVQRLEVIQLEPLDNELGGYLEHKFARFGIKLKDVISDDGIDAIRRRLVVIPRGGSKADARSDCYPQAVQNLVTRALNAAAKNCMPLVTADVILGC